MGRLSSAAVAGGVGCLLAIALVLADRGPGLLGTSGASPALAAPAGTAASGLFVRVTPKRGLVGGEAVTVAGRGLSRATGRADATWFVVECTAAVQGHMDPSTDTLHCDLTAAQPVKVTRNGSFSATYRVVTGIVGDGYCGTTGHLGCVLVVGTAEGRGTTVRITFKGPAVPTPTPAPAAPGGSPAPSGTSAVPTG
jgi:hypothetical protein